MNKSYPYLLCLLILTCVFLPGASAIQLTGDSTIHDKESGLIWQQADAAAMSWTEADQYCNQLEIEGLTNWRLPYKEELKNVLQVAVFSGIFTSGETTKTYWSLSPVEDGLNQYWAIPVKNLRSSIFDGNTNFFSVRCLSETPETFYLPLLHRWSQAWSNQDLDGYLNLYGKNFIPEGQIARETWEEQRRKRLKVPVSIKIKLSNIQIISELGDLAELKFTQQYSSNSYKDEVEKVLTLKVEKDSLVIVRERIL